MRIARVKLDDTWPFDKPRPIAYRALFEMLPIPSRDTLMLGLSVVSVARSRASQGFRRIVHRSRGRGKTVGHRGYLASETFADHYTKNQECRQHSLARHRLFACHPQLKRLAFELDQEPG